MYSKSSLLDELVKRVKENLQADNADTEDDDDDYFSEENEFDDELPIWIKFGNSLFKTKISITMPNSILFWSCKQDKISYFHGFIQETTGLCFKDRN